MGDYIAVRERRLEDGTKSAKIIMAGSDPDIVHSMIRKDIREHSGKGVNFTYYFYKPFRTGEDREGWIIGEGADYQL